MRAREDAVGKFSWKAGGSDGKRLEREADWLAGQAADGQGCPAWPCPYPLRTEPDCVNCWREAARQALEEAGR